jgi:Fe-S-cluster containining protein
MSGAPRTARELACLSCREKICCSHYIVSVTGHDIWRIMRALQIAPADFLRYIELAGEAPGLFQLAPDGPFCQLVLAKRELPEPLPSPCVFLLRTRDGQALCGLDDLRPGQCQSYPVFQDRDEIRLINDPQGCVRTWSHDDLDLPRERPRLQRLADQEAHHRDVVAAWNQRMRQDGRARSFNEFCSYLVNRQAEEEVRS